MRRPLTILISGVGVAGPTLAYWLHRRGHRPILVERMPQLRVGGHAVDIRGTALEVVSRMGLVAAVRDARTQIYTLSVVRADGRRTYDIRLLASHETRGDHDVEIMRDDLVRILFDAIAQDVEVVFGDWLRAIAPHESGGVAVEFEHGPPRKVDVVIGADGHHLRVRELTFGPEGRFTTHLGAYLSIYTLDNVLGLADQAVLYNEPGRGAAMFTVRGNERAKAVLLFGSRPLDIDFGDPEIQRRLLRERFAGMGWETSYLIDALPDAHDFYFDEMSQVKMPHWSKGRVGLLGDAAFGPSPMSGQGTSLALIGAYLLAYHLSAAADPVEGFALWERGFRRNVTQNQDLAIGGLTTLLPASRTAILARNQAMRMLPVLARLGLGFGGRVERASRAMTLPD